MIRLVLFVASLAALSFAVPECIFESKLNGTGLSDKQIHQIATEYNKGTPRKKIDAFVAKLGKNPHKKHVKTVLMRIFNTDVYLSRLFQSCLMQAQPLLSAEVVAEIKKLRQENDKAFCTSFVNFQNALVEAAAKSVDPSKAEAVKDAFNGPLKDLKTQQQKKQLIESIAYFAA